MRKNFGAKSWIYPMPVLIVATYGPDGAPNAMNAAWGGIYDTDEVMICLSHDHKTTVNIKERGAFTVSFATAEYVAACDYVGIVSANDVPDKFARAGFHATKSELVDAPLIDELPVALECELIRFNEDGICIGRIVNASADVSVLDSDGNVDTGKVNPILFDSIAENYATFGKVVGVAFSEGNKIGE
ncbi:MAG: flavin reductase family protein [Clostridia bacterium]|nr:flavin reductase family protein [Clostridia bacterium]